MDASLTLAHTGRMRYILLVAFLAGCAEEAMSPVDPSDELVPLDAHEMLAGERLQLAHFTASEGTIVRFAVVGSNLQPLAVGVTYEGQRSAPDPHHSYAWLGASQADPYADGTPAPLVAGDYRVELGCGDEAALPCVFSFKAWIAH